ncbi:hypothetical protein GJ496_009615 [Pomphorhynchus laevis]|nr:hypothetical protein GJ496_009615 [Pomphorhynchus laevis]
MCTYFKCDLCDQRYSDTRYPVEYLVDSDSMNTCWRSALLPQPSPSHMTSLPSSSNDKQKTLNRESNLNENSLPLVEIHIPFGRPYELSYITIRFCERIPLIFAFYKSNDYGQSWQLLRLFWYHKNRSKITYNDADDRYKDSDSCPFNNFVHVQNDKQYETNNIHMNNVYEQLCFPFTVDSTYVLTSSHSDDKHEPQSSQNPKVPNDYNLPHQSEKPKRIFERISFTLFNSWIRSQIIRSNFTFRDWSIATDIKLKLIKPDCVVKRFKQNITHNFYSIADIAIGGRCMCNRHASSCSTNRYQSFANLMVL